MKWGRNRERVKRSRENDSRLKEGWSWKKGNWGSLWREDKDGRENEENRERKV